MKNYFLLSAAALMLSAATPTAFAQDAAKTTDSSAAKPAEAPAAKPADKPAAKPAATASGFGPVDTNNDNIVTKAEADAAAKAEFDVFDADKDGKVSTDEFKTVLFKINAKSLPNDEAKKKADPMIQTRFKSLDTNADSKVSKDEFLADATKRHKMFDENGDGKVTKNEVTDIGTKMKKRMAEMKAAAEKKAAAAAAPAVKK